MNPYINIFGKMIPAYGLMITLGLMIANVVMYCKVDRKNKNDFWILEGYVLLGAMIGAKGLYILVSFSKIDWQHFHDIAYLTAMIKGGFVFFGGLLGGIAACFFAGRLHHIEVFAILRKVIFGVPLAHGFGRIGCFLAGCCYGIPYKGCFAVVYPEFSYGPSGVSCFPVQILETILLWSLSFAVWKVSEGGKVNPISFYLIGYSVERFFLEFLRADVARGTVGMLSTSQFISILIVMTTIVVSVVSHKRVVPNS